MATKVEVLGRMVDNFTMEQKLAGAQMAWELTVPGGVLSRVNSIELLMQLSTRSISTTILPKPQELELKDTYVIKGGNLRSSWSYVGIDGSRESIFQAIYTVGAGGTIDAEHSDGTVREGTPYELYQITGGAPSFTNRTIEEVPLVPSPRSSGDANSNQRVGIADRPAYLWFYLFGFTLLQIIEDPVDRDQDKQVYLKHSSAPKPPDQPWSLYGDSLFICGKTDGFSNQFWIMEFSTVDVNVSDNSAILKSHVDNTFYSHTWVYAVHATESWLYVLLRGSDGLMHIVKLTKDGNYTVAADYNLDIAPHAQAFYVVSEDLIYIAKNQSNIGPLSIYTWTGGDDGELVEIDPAVSGGPWWNIWVANVFPSFVTMGYQVVQGQSYLYIGTDGQNGNSTKIYKIGIGGRQPLCP